MANILILNGSPRKNGATASLAKALIDGAKENGNEIKEPRHRK
ncbi:MAG: NAD(P)H-dependent oxidoreductase [Clostridia bacterium]|nr:NAD(P)H-dependent oxidoreductase [Clostridia bacterium]